MKITMLNNTALVEPVVNKDHIGKIVIPSEEAGVPYTGVVKCVSDDFEYDIKKGDTIIFKRFKEIRMSSGFWIIRGADVIGKISKMDVK